MEKTKTVWCDTCWHRYKTSQQYPCNVCLREGVEKYHDPIPERELMKFAE